MAEFVLVLADEDSAPLQGWWIIQLGVPVSMADQAFRCAAVGLRNPLPAGTQGMQGPCPGMGIFVQH